MNLPSFSIFIKMSFLLSELAYTSDGPVANAQTSHLLALASHIQEILKKDKKLEGNIKSLIVYKYTAVANYSNIAISF